jgi:GNAT superfamily N-acetyltransferase
MSLKPLTEPVIRRLTSEGLTAFLCQSQKFEAVLRPGCDLILSNEPVADMNALMIGPGAVESGCFADACQACLAGDLPFLAILFPEAGQEAKDVAAAAGLAYAVDFPFMVRNDEPIEPLGNEAIDVWRASESERDLGGHAEVLAAAFKMPLDSTRRCFPPSSVWSPNIDIYLAGSDERIVGSVTFTHHGDTTGVWGMGTATDQQGRGIGRRLLSTAMAEARSRGSKRFFLGATPAGFPLYEKLGYETQMVTSGWVAGETSQA